MFYFCKYNNFLIVFEMLKIIKILEFFCSKKVESIYITKFRHYILFLPKNYKKLQKIAKVVTCFF